MILCQLIYCCTCPLTVVGVIEEERYKSILGTWDTQAQSGEKSFGEKSGGDWKTNLVVVTNITFNVVSKFAFYEELLKFILLQFSLGMLLILC